MSGFLFVFALPLVATSSLVSADDIDMFRRLQNAEVRLAVVEEATESGVSDVCPTPSTDTNFPSDIWAQLFEQRAVPAESATAIRPLDLDDEDPTTDEPTSESPLVDPIVDDTGPDYECGEVPLPDVPTEVSESANAPPAQRSGQRGGVRRGYPARQGWSFGQRRGRSYRGGYRR
jgi:hypothetical protein